MSYAVIQGSSKGIGLAITRHLLKSTSLRVVATTSQTNNVHAARDAALDGLKNGSGAEKRLISLPLDVMDESSISYARDQVHEKLGRNMRLLVNVSGMLHAEKSLSDVDLASLTKSFQINTLGHLLVYKHFVSLIPERQKKHNGHSSSIFEGENAQEDRDASNGILPLDKSTLVSFSARVGSIGDNHKGGWYSYRSSKAATNQMVHTLGLELAMRKLPATAFAYHPGTVKTALSKDYVEGKEVNESEGLFTPEMAAGKFVDLLRRVGDGGVKNGGFVAWDGSEVPW